LTSRLEHASTELRKLRAQVGERLEFKNIIGESEPMQRVFALISTVADVDSNVMIQGESGTGKELVARAIHAASRRANGPFVAINCGALPEPLLESELFGHAKGAFTGAVADKRGLFLEASGGTIFLDEIGEMSNGMQVKLLRVLQDREVRAVGSNVATHVDVRVLAATHRDLYEMTRDDRFRSDLYYRINVITIDMPALRDRRTDILPLARHFVEKYSARFDRKIFGISAEAESALERYDWPGNVRELENVIERAIVLTNSGSIGLEHLPQPVAQSKSTTIDASIPMRLEEMEHLMIRAALERNDGNRAKTAGELGISETTLWRKLKQLGL
jgi:transcriptional regulator with PAS, ATPase and Fis domain